MKYKYFIKDEALNTSDDDYFGHVDIAENIQRMIDNTDAPFNIAIIGKWGMGKSSLINMVKKILQSNSDKYLVQEINAWKYQKEEFGKAFLKQLLQLVEGKQFTTQQQFDHTLGKYLEEPALDVAENRADRFSVKKLPGILCSFFHEKKKYIVKGVIFFLVTFLAVFLYKILALQKSPFDGNFLELLRASILCYCKNVVVVLIVPLFVWYGKIYMDKMVGRQNLQVGVTMPLESRDDYEIYLRAALKKNRNKKIITVIDDLDRLDMAKIVEALDALKVFMDLDNCIFIVPFDDAILKKALDQKRIKNLSSTESEIDSELVLDKLFQYKIYIPELVKINVKEYAVELFRKNCTDFVREYMNDNMDDACRIVRNVIIHNHVTTPRQVKKLLNNFMNNLMVAYNRQERGMIQDGFVTELESLQFIAKISVLQADYNEFYDLLFVDFNAMDELLAIYRDQADVVPEYLSEYFYIGKENNEVHLKSKYKSLIDYLIYTEKYRGTASIASYMYMAQDKISVLTGDRIQQEFITSALSKNVQSVREMLDETPVLAEKLSQFLMLSDDMDEVMMICNMSVNVIDIVKEPYRKELISEISNRLGNCIEYVDDTGVSWLNFDLYFVAKEEAEEPQIFDTALKKYMSDAMKADDAVSILAAILKHRRELSTDTDSDLRRHIRNFVDEGEYGCAQINEMCADLDDESVAEYFGDGVFERIADDILEHADLESGETGKDFLRYFSIYVDEENISDYGDLLTRMAANTKAHKLLADTLSTENMFEAIPKDIGTAILKEITANEVEDSTEGTYCILSALPYVVDESEEQDENTLDPFINNSDLSEDLLISIIENYVANGNNIELLKDTIEDLSISASKEEEKLEALCKLSKHYSTAQNKFLVELLEKRTAFESNKDYDYEKELIRRLYRESAFSDEIVTLVSDKLITWQEDYGNKLPYLEFVIFAVEEVIEDLETETADEAANGFLSRYALFPAEVIRVFNNIGEYVSEDVLVDAAEKFKDVSEPVLIDSVARFYFVNAAIFIEGNQNLSELLNFIERNWDELTDKKEALNALHWRYGRINTKSVVNLSKKIVSDSKILPDAKKCMGKFYDNLNMEELSLLMIDLVRESDIDDMKELLFGGETSRTLEEVITYIADNPETFVKSDLEIGLDILHGSTAKNDNRWNKICHAYLLQNQNVAQNEKMLDGIIEEVKHNGRDKEKVLPLLLLIYGNTASDNLKSRVIATVKELGITRKFKKLLGEEEKKEFETLGKKGPLTSQAE